MGAPTGELSMAELKTKPTKQSVAAFLKGITPPERRRDCQTVLRIMQKATGEKPRMWGTSIVGFGSYHYKYASGREGDWFVMGFSPRKQDLTLYLMPNLGRLVPMLKKLGTHKAGGSCLYLHSLADVDLAVLIRMIEQTVLDMRRMSGASPSFARSR